MIGLTTGLTGVRRIRIQIHTQCDIVVEAAFDVGEPIFIILFCQVHAVTTTNNCEVNPRSLHFFPIDYSLMLANVNPLRCTITRAIPPIKMIEPVIHAVAIRMNNGAHC